MRARPWEALEIGKSVEREIDFAGRAAEFVTANALEKITGQFVWFKKFFEGEMRVDTGEDGLRGELFSILKGNAAGAAVLGEDLADGRLGADFDPGFAGCMGDAFEMAPVPPRLKPQERKAPSISPM